MKVINIFVLFMLCLSFSSVMALGESDGAGEKIVSENESSITVVDAVGRTVTIPLPVEKIIPTDYRTTEALLAIGCRDMIVGLDKAFHDRMAEFGLKDVPEVSMHGAETNFEQILTLEPDLVILPEWQSTQAEDIIRNLPGVNVIVMGCTARDQMIPELKIMGKVLGKSSEADKLVSWVQKYDDVIESRTKDIKSEDMPSFYYEYMSGSKKWWAITPSDLSAGMVAEGCGGRNIASSLNGSSVEVEPEWILTQNPDFIFMDLMKGFDSGPGKTDSDMKTLLENIENERVTEGFLNLNAVKNDHVYLIDRDIITGPRWVIGHVYIAKCLHPELFEDIDPDEMHRDYLETFQGIQLDGTWVYPHPK